jgi:hypothetical protein
MYVCLMSESSGLIKGNVMTMNQGRDGITGWEVGHDEFWQYVFTVDGGIYRRGSWAENTYGGWRYEAEPAHVVRYGALYPAGMSETVRAMLTEAN